MTFKMALASFLAMALVQIGTSVSHAKLSITTVSPQMDLATGQEKLYLAPIQANVSTFRYGSPTGFMPPGIEETAISLKFSHVSNPAIEGWVILSVWNIRTEAATLLRAMILSQQSFVLAFPEWQPVKFDGNMNGPRMRETMIQFPNGELIAYEDLTARSIEAGRPVTLIGEIVRKIRERMAK